MDQAVATEYHVDPGHFVAGDVEIQEGHSGASVPLPVGCYKLRDDVDSDVAIQTQIGLLHPVEISTGSIEQRPRVDRPEQDR